MKGIAKALCAIMIIVGGLLLAEGFNAGKSSGGHLFMAAAMFWGFAVLGLIKMDENER